MTTSILESSADLEVPASSLYSCAKIAVSLHGPAKNALLESAKKIAPHALAGIFSVRIPFAKYWQFTQDAFPKNFIRDSLSFFYSAVQSAYSAAEFIPFTNERAAGRVVLQHIHGLARANPLWKIALISQGDTSEIVHACLREPHLPFEYTMQRLVEWVWRMRQALGESWSPSALCFHHRLPSSWQREHMSILEQMAGCEVFFNCAKNAIVVPTNTFESDRQIPEEAFIPEHLEDLRKAEQTYASPANISDRVREILHRASLKDLQLDQAFAAELKMHPRALQRSLQYLGTSYRALRDEVIKERFQQLLTTGARIQQISNELAYSDSGALRRARRRWHKKRLDFQST